MTFDRAVFSYLPFARICLLLLVFSSMTVQANTKSTSTNIKAPLSINGKWINQRGSILQLKQGKNNTLSGTFSTAVATDKSCIGYPAAVAGYQNNNVISLSMSLHGCQAPVVISMTGGFYQSAEKQLVLKMMSVVQYSGADLWNSRIVTIDTYHRAKPKSATE